MPSRGKGTLLLIKVRNMQTDLFVLKLTQIDFSFHQAKLCGPVIEKNYELESEDEALSDPVVCSVCDGHYHTSAFWICCDIRNQWYHGKCVKITAKKANRIKHYECPECFNDRIGHN